MSDLALERSSFPEAASEGRVHRHAYEPQGQIELVGRLEDVAAGLSTIRLLDMPFPMWRLPI